MVVVRTGGFAGVRDLMRVAADGTARITVRTGDTRDCTPSPASLDRLRAIDLVALNATPTKLSRMADGSATRCRQETAAPPRVRVTTAAAPSSSTRRPL